MAGFYYVPYRPEGHGVYRLPERFQVPPTPGDEGKRAPSAALLGGSRGLPPPRPVQPYSPYPGVVAPGSLTLPPSMFEIGTPAWTDAVQRTSLASRAFA